MAPNSRRLLPYPGLLGLAIADALSAREQVIPYSVSTPPDNVLAEDRAFSGVWIGMVGNQPSDFLIVKQVFIDGTVATKCGWGRNACWYISQPGFILWQGKIANAVLTLSGPARFKWPASRVGSVV
jgi:hypothetical protein